MERTLSWLFAVYFIGFILYGLGWHVICLVYCIKCFNVTECTNKKCHMRYYCDKWEETYSKEEIETLYKLLHTHGKCSPWDGMRKNVRIAHVVKFVRSCQRYHLALWQVYCCFELL